MIEQTQNIQTKRTPRVVVHDFAMELIKIKHQPGVDIMIQTLQMVCTRMGWDALYNEIKTAKQNADVKHQRELKCVYCELTIPECKCPL